MKIAFVLQILSVLFQYRMVDALYNFGDEPEDPKRIRIYLEADERLVVPKDSKVEYVSPDEEIIMDKPIFPPLVYKGIKKPLPPQFLYNKIATPVGLYQKPAFTLEDLRVKTDSFGHPGGYLNDQGSIGAQFDAPTSIGGHFDAQRSIAEHLNSQRSIGGHFDTQAQLLVQHDEQGQLGGHFDGQSASSYGHLNAIHAQVKDSPIAYGKLLRPILLLPNGWIHGVNLNSPDQEKPVTESQPDDIKYDFRTKTHHLR